MESGIKYTTEYGTGKIHYYKNIKTGKISEFDIKMKIEKPKRIRKDVKDNFWIMDLDKDFNPTGIRR
ncbi:MAG: hypothetical protein Q4F95_04060 [Oscillospiraceae bacterium]|nr:hypothetical protein [Oscillospiraceae bacterium]